MTAAPTTARGQSAPTPAVELSAVTKQFAVRRGDVTALWGIDLVVERGEFVALIGPSGCGKSTLLRVIADLIEPTSGTVQVNGKSARQARLDQDYGFAFQQAGLLDWRTVQANVELPLELHGVSRAKRKSRALELLDLVGLADFAKQRPPQLSGGMQQRVAIARALAESPALLLMDEPFGALDEMTRERMQTELVRIAGETDAAVVFVTHSIPEAVFLSHRVVVMSSRPGRVANVIPVALGDRTDDTRESPQFYATITQVREALRGRSVSDAVEVGVAIDKAQGGAVISTARRAAVVVLPPVVFGIAAVALWQLLVRAAHIRSYVLPAPSDIWSAAKDAHSPILSAAGHSGLNSLVGLAAGVVLGVLLAALSTRVPLLGGTITPLVAGLAAMPIVALAPLLNNMYSPLSTLPRREIVAISAFVPMYITVLRGLSRLTPVHRELMHSYAASGSAVLRTVRVPGALPYFFTGLRVASSLAVIAAVVSEYFGGLNDGLGSRITSSVGATDYPAAWASVFGAVVLGLMFYVSALLLERLVIGPRAAALT